MHFFKCFRSGFFFDFRVRFGSPKPLFWLPKRGKRELKIGIEHGWRPRSVSGASRECPGTVPGGPREPLGSVQERPESVRERPEASPKRSGSVPGAFLERFGCSRTLKWRLGASQDRFVGFLGGSEQEFGMLGGILGDLGCVLACTRARTRTSTSTRRRTRTRTHMHTHMHAHAHAEVQVWNFCN